MNTVIQQWVKDYNCATKKDYSQALKEILQNLTLLALSRAKFFDQAAFYGGTALRIFHNLPRFSEDLDFTLKKTDASFSLKTYFKSIERELDAYGFDVRVDPVEKTVESDVESAFLKTGTKIHLLKIDPANAIADQIQSNELIQIKFEVDIEPATSFESELLPILRPTAFSAEVLKPSSLFAGKMHALLFRKWKSRVKGRDFYDLLHYLGRGIPVRLEYLEEKMRMGSSWHEQRALTRDDLLEMYKRRVSVVDFNQAKRDVAPFIRDSRELDSWSKDYFLSVADRIQVI